MDIKNDYNKEELSLALNKIINNKPEVIFISGNLAYLGRGEFKNKQETLDTYLSFIREASPSQVTIVTSTFTHDIINTDTPYSQTRQSMHGVIANYFLTHSDSVRSEHPFSSFCAIGPKAEFICTNNTKHPYGIDSPYERMLSLQNPLTISIGMPPNLTCSVIHQAEFDMHVPYRYIKEFYHPIEQDGEVVYENYYLPVLYRGMEEKRNLNKKFFANFECRHEIKSEKVGKGTLYSYEMDKFYHSAIKDMKEDIYYWLDEEPVNKPYRI